MTKKQISDNVTHFVTVTLRPSYLTLSVNVTTPTGFGRANWL
jgi:hypothetical protein